MSNVNQSQTEPPAVMMRPPFLFLGFLIIGHILDHLLPIPLGLPENHVARHAVSGALLALGIAVFAIAVRNFTRAGTPVPSTEPALVLVTGGIHGWSRNPIYVGMFLVYASIGMLLRGTWIFVLLVPLVFLMRYGVVAREETYLERRFGDAYRDYKARVRRWI